MILSVSRRTDVPAFYADWFFDRLKDGFVLVPNPINQQKIARIELGGGDDKILKKKILKVVKLFNSNRSMQEIQKAVESDKD